MTLEILYEDGRQKFVDTREVTIEKNRFSYSKDFSHSFGPAPFDESKVSKLFINGTLEWEKDENEAEQLETKDSTEIFTFNKITVVIQHDEGGKQ